jgi:hypothetical protein
VCGVSQESKIAVSVADLNNTFRQVDRRAGSSAQKGADKELSLSEFVESLVRLSVQVMGSTAAGKKGIKEGKSAEGLKRLLERHVVQNAAKEAMQEMRHAMVQAS